ncbi:MAG: hypothetical protein WD941_06190 [Opitutus sp.]
MLVLMLLLVLVLVLEWLRLRARFLRLRLPLYAIIDPLRAFSRRFSRAHRSFIQI